MGVLESLDLVSRTRVLPRGRSLYRFSNNFARFWFRLVQPGMHHIEQGLYEPVLGEVLRRI